MELSDKQNEVLAAEGHLLVTGGPGSGKTTAAILKAVQIAQRLRPAEGVLFLSFARATVSRVLEAIEYEQTIPREARRLIEVETYHSFFWRILRTHGYLVGLPRRLSVLTPSDEAVALSEVRAAFPGKKLSDEQKAAKAAATAAERCRLATAEGRVCFDLYAHYVGELLHGSARIRRLVATMYPVLILDEFQDTNEAQWRVVQALGLSCRIIALADPEQRIFDWIGANPARLGQFRDTFSPVAVDLANDNHRSSGTDIAAFGNDILTGQFRTGTYGGVSVESYTPFHAPAMTKVVTSVYSARSRLLAQGLDRWSLAVLVPTKRLARLVSDALREPPSGMAPVPHTAIVEMEGAVLGAEIVALILQSRANRRFLKQLFELLANFYRGKGGDEPTAKALKEADGIERGCAELAVCEREGKALRKTCVIARSIAVFEQTGRVKLTGNPESDWRDVQRVLLDGDCSRLREVAEEVRNLRLLGRGALLREGLARDWRENGHYRNALAIMRQALVQEHLATATRPELGVVVMNMHKAKGKQFDEVIVFEGWPTTGGGQTFNPDRIVRLNAAGQITDQARQTFRVSVTRAKQRTTILTPSGDRCVLLPAT